MSSKNGKIYPSTDEILKPTERRRKNSNTAIAQASPRNSSNNNNNNNSYNSSNNNRPPINRTSSRQNSFQGLHTSPSVTNSKHMNNGGGGDGSNAASPRAPPPLSRARSFADGETRSRSNSLTARSPASSSLRKNNSFRTRRIKRVTFRNPLTEYEPVGGSGGNDDFTPTDNEYSSSSSPLLLDDDLKRRQDTRKKRRQERLERSSSSYTLEHNGVSCFGLIYDGCTMAASNSCVIS